MKLASLLLSFLLAFTIAAPTRAHSKKHWRSASDHGYEAIDLIRLAMESEQATIPPAVIDRAQAIAVFPYANRFEFTVESGYGLVSLRDPRSQMWELPICLKLDNERFEKWRKKGENVDLILIGLNQRAACLFLNNEFHIDSCATVSPAPIKMASHSNAPTIIYNSDFCCYCRSFNSLNGAMIADVTICQDRDLNRAAYGEGEIKRLNLSSEHAPLSFFQFIQLLNQYSANHGNCVNQNLSCPTCK